jgi:hypothetical protein
MKNRGIVALALSAAAILILLPLRASSWDAATHTYIEEHLSKKQGQLDEGIMHNRIYGASVMDLFNSTFTSPYVEFAAYLHDPSQENFLKVWEQADTEIEEAAAYGFVGHNNTWGMDATAHVSGITTGREQGYVIAKSIMLAALIRPALEAQLGPLPDPVVMEICHYFVEAGVDFLVRGMDPAIGSKMMAAALNRSDEVPALLIKAYQDEFAALAGGADNAALIIATAEGTYRAYLTGYGWALTQADALDRVALQMAVVGAEFLGLPPQAAPDLVPTVKQGILAAMSLCASDIDRELKASTGWVNGRLSSHRISW